MRPDDEAAPAATNVPAAESTTRIRLRSLCAPGERISPSGRELDMRALLAFAVKAGASDLHLVGNEPASLRIDGVMQRVRMKALTPDAVEELVTSIMSEPQRLALKAGNEVGFSYALPGLARFRVDAFVDRCGVAAALRAIPAVIPTLESLGLPPAAATLCQRDSGLVIVNGPTGSGKSTTLAAMIGAINARRRGRIITIEDPIEFVHYSGKSVVSQRELGLHTKSFAAALRSALREDPDVILVGELGDVETTRLALTAAETGHLVLSSVRSPSASRAAVERILDLFPPAQQGPAHARLADCLAGVVTQRLVPGSRGERVIAVEVLVATPAVRTLVRDGKGRAIASIMQVGSEDGMRTMGAALAEPVDRGVVEAEDVASLRSRRAAG